nr:hypothetical protein CFP56_52204 [Quercus suber]
MFYYKYTSDSLTKVTEDCLIYSLIISSVEIGDLIDEDVRTIVQTTYSTPLPNEAPEDTKKREETIVAMVANEHCSGSCSSHIFNGLIRVDECERVGLARICAPYSLKEEGKDGLL